MKQLIYYIGPMIMGLIIAVTLLYVEAPALEEQQVVKKELLYIPNVRSPKSPPTTFEEVERGEGFRIEGNMNTSTMLFSIKGEAPILTARHSAISVTCGKGRIEVSYDTGEATFTDGCNPSEASKALWEGIKPFIGGCAQ